MALKPDRQLEPVEDITNFWSETQTTAERGGIASASSFGSGVAMDNSNNVVEYAANPSGAVPKGVLLVPVNPPLSDDRDFINFQNQEVRPGDKVPLQRKGFVVTDMITSGVNPSGGDTAYLGASGKVTNSQAAGAPAVGRFETTKDSDGFARVFIDI